MTDHEVIVKGELHSSRGDHAHERELLIEGVDHLVLEGSREEAEYGLFQQWYAFAMLLTEYLFFRPFYTDSSVLEDIVKAQGGDVKRTRESDASVLENSHVLARIAAALLFLVLFFTATLFAIAGIHFYGASSLLLSVMLPPLFLRIHESNRSTGSRDEKMAELIAEAAEDGGRVIAVVGNNTPIPYVIISRNGLIRCEKIRCIPDSRQNMLRTSPTLYSSPSAFSGSSTPSSRRTPNLRGCYPNPFLYII